MSNQYTADPDSPKAERSKDRTRAEMLAQRFYAFCMGEEDEHGRMVDLTQAQVQAAKVLIDKGKPNLSAVDTTIFDGDAEVNATEVEARLRMLIAKAEPALLSRILGERARQAGDTPVEAVPDAGEQAA